MIITWIRLRNIKSFVDEELHFARGINIIAGRNGAGKSTVIEAVGLALFDAWPQRFKEGNARAGFLRNGTRDGGIEVTVLRDGVAFTVRCDLAQRTKAGKASIDYERALLDGHGVEIAKSAGRKKEFQDDIRRELLGEARIDDDKLFRDIIGTEQGAFDEPFTRIESERKEIFEKILGIADFQDFEKQFYQLVKWQSGKAKELGIRLDERAGLSAELTEAESLLTEREIAVKDAAKALKSATSQAAAARKAVDAMADSRDALQRAQAERERLGEKLKGEETAVESARKLLDEAVAASAALEAARPGHVAFLAAEAALTALRESAKQREATGRVLAEETTAFEKTNAELLTRQESQQKELVRLDGEIVATQKSIEEINIRIEEMRTAYRALDDARKSADERATLAGELRSYVQDLRTTRDALENAGESMRQLHETFAAITLRLDDMKLEADFLPALREETERMYARHSAVEGRTEEDDALGRMFAEAQRIETQLRKEAAGAADLASRKEQEGKGERRLLDQREAELKKLTARKDETEKALEILTRQLGERVAAWRTREKELRAALDTHGDVEALIAENEKRIDEHRSAHATFLAQESATALHDQRKQAHAAAVATAEQTRRALEALAATLDALAKAFSEAEYSTAKAALDTALAEEKTATALHGDVAARAEEQHAAVKKLRKEHREYERLRTQAARAKAEAAFSSEVHQHVVRELARHVGASIVSALSAFAAELYTRIAPEQDLMLFWDPQTY
ncbi:MAG: hypothetical protein IH600_05285, partial [Bacteroidetes bacterium]|nr:hypothetical protein [Bacteroidota bacterium]